MPPEGLPAIAAWPYIADDEILSAATAKFCLPEKHEIAMARPAQGVL